MVDNRFGAHAQLQISAWLGDEQRVVSFKDLGRELSLSANVAKAQLRTYVQSHSAAVVAVYAVTGKQRETQAVVVRLVAAAKLEETKGDMDEIYNEHVYSVQAHSPKDPASLFPFDIVGGDFGQNSNKSIRRHIRGPKVVRKVRTAPAAPAAAAPAAAAATGAAAAPAGAQLVAASPTSAKPANAQPASSTKKSPSPAAAAGKKKVPVNASFFGKAKPKPTAAAEAAPASVTTATADEDEDDDFVGTRKRRHTRIEDGNESQESEDEEEKDRKRRQATAALPSFDDDDKDTMDTSAVEASQQSQQTEQQQSQPAEENAKETGQLSAQPSAPPPQTSSGVKRQQVAKRKTFVDERGYMVTQMVMEWEELPSTTASVSTPATPTPPDSASSSTTTQSSSATPSAATTSPTTKKSSDPKGGAKKDAKAQSSIMTFFKK